MKRRNFFIRTFRCPICLNYMYAPKISNRMTAGGHEKKLWCPYCRIEVNMEQVDSEFHKG